jgi:uncharacterized membrane protein YuzA (DUF378 family)
MVYEGANLDTVVNVAMLLAAVGALNWGAIALMDVNLVTSVFGSGQLTTLIYGLAGLGGTVQLGQLADQYM